ncbi:hypothetical protein [Paenibacillus sp. UNC499MF]|uniref:hypothetical protein n=1 Tax=Paenibacillus sp. UNC499MF TaxID=1502751 RepID=UPI00089FBD04|nr:hypothetical protein [Paenibacillus sp. UNC499MF]SEG37163.1 hypothetical protein SAMN02799616_02708 [Paenibacillus sp. UNC499MF]
MKTIEIRNPLLPLLAGSLFSVFMFVTLMIQSWDQPASLRPLIVLGLLFALFTAGCVLLDMIESRHVEFEGRVTAYNNGRLSLKTREGKVKRYRLPSKEIPPGESGELLEAGNQVKATVTKRTGQLLALEVLSG